MSKSIAVLFHEKTKRFLIKKYSIDVMSKFWREDGFKVKYLFGTTSRVDADICIVHVDLSVVPNSYIDYAHQFPVVLNGKISNICKRSFSKNLVTSGNDYSGKVIVKTDLNYAGWPEKVVASNIGTLALHKFGKKIGFPLSKFVSHTDYRVFESFKDVPEKYINNRNYVIEKFIPEIDGDYFCLNSYIFFGDVHQGLRHWSRQPVVVSATSIRRAVIDPHAEIKKIRESMNIDFGKLDYIVQNGKVVLFDVNKTVGTVSGKITPEFLKSIRQRATAINQYF